MLSGACLSSALRRAEHASLETLDGWRSAALSRLGRLAFVAELRRARPLRLQLLACLAVLVAFVGAVRFTPLLLALSPVLVGVPHLVSDVRYLLLPSLRESGGTTRSGARAVLGLYAAAALLGLCGAAGLALGAACLAVACTALRVVPGMAARLVLAAAGAGILLLALAHTQLVSLLLAQGHNFVALGIGAWFLRGKLRGAGAPALLLLAAVLTIALGGCDGWLARPELGGWGGSVLREVTRVAAPAGASPVVVQRCVALFGFAQAVHYSTWLSLVPDAARSSERPVSFRRSFQLLCTDLGPLGARLAIAASLALPLAACLSLGAARRSYVGLAIFHGFLELGWLATRLLSRQSVPSSAATLARAPGLRVPA